MPAQHEVLYDPTNPYPWYRHMRETDPVHYSEQIKMWYVFRHDDVQRILADVQTFSSAGAHGDTYLEASFLHMDPPRHGRYRTLVSQAFTAGFFQGTKQFPIAFTAERRHPTLVG